MFLSDCFRRNWRRRIGGDPSQTQVQEAIRKGTPVQRGRRFLDTEGKPQSTLSVYLFRGVAYTVDEVRKVAVSVYTDRRASAREARKRRERKC